MRLLPGIGQKSHERCGACGGAVDERRPGLRDVDADGRLQRYHQGCAPSLSIGLARAAAEGRPRASRR